jgi:hypothetical protein
MPTGKSIPDIHQLDVEKVDSMELVEDTDKAGFFQDLSKFLSRDRCESGHKRYTPTCMTSVETRRGEIHTPFGLN